MSWLHLQYMAGRSENYYWTHRRTDAQLALITPIAHHLPDFSITFGLKDEPQFMFDHGVREELLAFAANGTSKFESSGPLHPRDFKIRL